MKERRKYILVLAISLLCFWIVSEFILADDYSYEYLIDNSYYDKNPKDAVGEARALFDSYNSHKEDESQIINLVRIIETIDFLVYEDLITAGTHYDLMKRILTPERSKALKNKEVYIQQTDKYLNRKRNTKIQYEKYGIAYPIIYYSKGNQEHASVFVIRTTSAETKHLKYDFVKLDNHWYYSTFRDVPKIKGND